MNFPPKRQELARFPVVREVCKIKENINVTRKEDRNLKPNI